jgi:hypothetical protein
MQVSHMTGDPAQALAPSRDALVLGDVFLLTEDMNGQLAVPRLTVVLDSTGLTVLKPDGTAGAVVGWGDLSEVRATGRMRTPTGEPGVVVEAVTAVRTHRFMVPTGDPDGLEREVLRRATVRGGKVRRKGGGSRFLVAAVGILLVAIVALIVLVVVGTVKF